MRRRTLGSEVEEVREWELVYDSGETTEELVRTPDISVAGYKELYIFARAPMSANNSSLRSCTAYITDTSGRKVQIILGKDVFANSGNPRGISSFIRKIGDLVVSDSKSSANLIDIFTTGCSADNLGNGISGVAFLGDMEKLYITNVNCNDYYFGVGSRFVIYGR